MSRTLLQIINDILDFSKVEAGKMELVPVHFNLHDLFHNLSSLNAFMAESKELSFYSDFAADVPQIAYGDDARIRQILMNIISNAIKYTREGSVKFSAKRHTENGIDYTAFIVEDTGIGIAEENLPKLFSMFEQFDAQKNRGITGTGLGLSIAQRLTTMMDGRIRVESEYGKGSKFTVLLPLPEGDPAEANRVELIERSVMVKGANILVVDDNSVNLKVALAYLGTHGIRAESVISGAAALDKIETKEYHLIFMDHMMPEMDGLETTAIIRNSETEWQRTVPIIALSANAVSGMRELFLESGMNDFLAKPIDAADLNRILSVWLPPELILPPDETAGKREVSAANVSRTYKKMDTAHIKSSVGITNAAGDEGFYVQVLAEIQVKHADDLNLIKDALESGNYNLAHRTAHTLKSTAATIGAKELSVMAGELENLLKDGAVKLPDDGSWEELNEEFNVTFEEMGKLIADFGQVIQKAETLDKDKAIGLIQKLEPLLTDELADCLDLIDEIHGTLSPVGENYQELVARMEEFEFGEAAKILAVIRAGIDSEIT
jgi:CheY-like chemotaxis protein